MGFILAAKFWREILIGVLSVLLVICLAVLNYKIGQLKEADQKCTAKINKIEQDQLKALAIAQNKVNKVSADYEQIKAEQRAKVETVTRTVQKIVERPIYKSVCIDDDGLSEINSLIEARDTS